MEYIHRADSGGLIWIKSERLELEPESVHDIYERGIHRDVVIRINSFRVLGRNDGVSGAQVMMGTNWDGC